MAEMPEFICKFWQIAFFSQLCVKGKNFQVQALDTRKEFGHGRIVLIATWLLLNERIFGLALAPTLKLLRTRGGQANHKNFLRNLSIRIAKKFEAVKFEVWW